MDHSGSFCICFVPDSYDNPNSSNNNKKRLKSKNDYPDIIGNKRVLLSILSVTEERLCVYYKSISVCNFNHRRNDSWISCVRINKTFLITLPAFTNIPLIGKNFICWTIV